MKAIVLREIGGPEKLQYEEMEIPTPKDSEVLVKLKYAAVNRRDFFITHGMYFGMRLPSVLGADGAGKVIALGKNVRNIEVGSEVVINPGINWGPKEEYGNRNFHVLGMPLDGTYAQYVVVSAENIYRKPEHLTFEEAAAIPLAGITAYRTLMTKGQVNAGETVLIPGIGGGVALFILQMAVATGAKVFVTSGSEEKIEKAKLLGAVGGINYHEKGWHKTLRKTVDGFDLILDGIGGADFNHLIDLTKPGGRIVTYGATNGPVPECVLPRIFSKNMDIRGSTMGSPREFVKFLAFYAEHQLHPIIDRCFPLEQMKEAHKYINQGRNFGKITIEIPQ